MRHAGDVEIGQKDVWSLVTSTPRTTTTAGGCKHFHSSRALGQLKVVHLAGIDNAVPPDSLLDHEICIADVRQLDEPLNVTNEPLKYLPYSPGTNSCGTVNNAEARSGEVLENASLSAITAE